MMPYANGMSHQSAPEEKPDGERYLTEPWMIEYLAHHVDRPRHDTLILDPCAAGWGGWTIGRHLADALHLPPEQVREADLHPLHPRVEQADGLAWVREQLLQAGARPVWVVYNPPYSEIQRWISDLRKATDMNPLARVFLVCALQALLTDPTRNDRSSDLRRVFAPCKRPAFGLAPMDAAARRGQRLAAGKRDDVIEPHPTSHTGLGLTSTGNPHGIAEYGPGGGLPWEVHHVPPAMIAASLRRARRIMGAGDDL